MSSRRPRIFASVLFVIGLMLAFGGVRLAFLGGSLYYLIAGCVIVASALLIWRGKKSGAWLYGLMLIATLIWSLAEVGFDWWALAPRLAMFSVLGSWLLVPGTRRKLNGGAAVTPLRKLRSAQVIAGALVVLTVVGLWFTRASSPLAVEHPTQFAATGDVDWKHWGRTSAGTRYAPFDSITAENVANLKKAWTFRTGVSDVFKATPLQVGNSLFVCTAANVVIAIDGENGKEQWRFDP
ncbi:MAG TPA: hypothetical protein VET48_10425, partial [Steroidobacteraceae bacterium]|nr:hypothetical protein [Steroidobacteraceae bacterium]